MKQHARRRGSSLAMALIVAALLLGMGAALATVSISYTREAASFRGADQALYAAEAGLEYVWDRATQDGSDAFGNVFLRDNASPTGQELPPMHVGGSTVVVVLYDLGGGTYRAESTAFLNARAESRDGRNVTVYDHASTVAQEFRASFSFSEYMFLRDDILNIGEHCVIRGKVHSNRQIRCYFGDITFENEATYVEDIKFWSGAKENAANPDRRVTFKEGRRKLDEKIPLPKAEIPALRSAASGPYLIEGGARTAIITAQGDSVRIQVREGGAIVSDQVVPPPSGGLIYADGNVIIQGDTSARYTVATAKKMFIAGRLRYVDEDGDLAYVLKRNGAVQKDNDTAPGVAWTADQGFEYVPNENFDMGGMPAPTLGLLAVGTIEVSKDAPYNMEIHAALLSADGNFTCSKERVKGNLRVVGSTVAKSGSRFEVDPDTLEYTGWGLSGEYIFDKNLVESPPPVYLEAKLPKKGPRWKMEANEVARPALD